MRKEIVEVEFVKDENGVYKKRILFDEPEFSIELVDVIDENNVKTVK